MTDHDVQLLVIGIAAGMDLMLLVHVVFAIRDDRRAARAARRRRRIAEADRYRGSLPLYQMQQRSRV